MKTRKKIVSMVLKCYSSSGAQTLQTIKQLYSYERCNFCGSLTFNCFRK